MVWYDKGSAYYKGRGAISIHGIVGDKSGDVYGKPYGGWAIHHRAQLRSMGHHPLKTLYYFK